MGGARVFVNSSRKRGVLPRAAPTAIVTIHPMGTQSLGKPAVAYRIVPALCIGLALAGSAAAVPPPNPAHQLQRAPAPAPEAPAPAPNDAANVALEFADDTLVVNPPAIVAAGTIKIALKSIAPQDVTLRLQAARQNDPAPRIAWGTAKAERQSFPLADGCPTAENCVVPFTILHVASAGAQDFRLEAHDAHNDTLLGSADLRVVRERPVVRAELTGDGVGPDAIVLSLLRTRDFTFHLKNPGSEAIIPVVGAALPDCPGQPNHKILSFTLTETALEPGADTVLRATVDPCIRIRLDKLTLRITDQNAAGAEIFARPLIIDPAFPIALAVRELPAWPVWYVLLGAVASIVLNNFFPFQRSRHTLRQFLAHAEGTLNDCANLSTGLADSLAAQVASCHAALNDLSWFWPSKTRLLGDIQATITALNATLVVASKLDQHRMMLLSKEDFLSTESCSVIAARLLDAEDALLAGDAGAAGIAMDDAQKRFDAIFADTEQVALRSSLNKRLSDIARQLNTFLALPAPHGNAEIRLVATRLDRDTSPAMVNPPANQQANQPANQPANQAANQALPARCVPAGAGVDELLAIERDLFIVETWFALIEPRLDEEHGRFGPFWREIHRALVMAPKCAKTRMMLGLVRADTTPQDIVDSLRHYGARIDCATRPYFYITYNYRVILNDPLLGCIQAVRHFIDYTWMFNADRTARSRTFQCRYFLQRPPLFSGQRDAFVTVTMQVPFTDGEVAIPARRVHPRDVAGEKSYAAGELVQFCVFTLAAIASAYLTKYGADPTAAVNTMTLQDMMTAILYGFGIDQLRDTVTNQASNRLSPAPPSSTPAAK